MNYKDEIEADIEYHNNICNDDEFQQGVNFGIALEKKRSRKLVEAIESYLEIQAFLALPDEDTCVSSSGFKEALKKYYGG